MANRLWLQASCAVAAFFGFQATTVAQDAATPPPAKPAAAKKDAPNAKASGVEESTIVITATKRAQNIQDVPIAVTALSAKDRETQNIRSVRDLTNAIPGVAYITVADRFYSRGFGRVTNNTGSDGDVAIYIDGAFSESSYGAAAPPILIDSTEFDKGPQTTLWGRNALGGALLLNTKAPSNVQTEEARAQYGSFNRYEVGGRVSGPLTDGLRYGITGDYSNQGGGPYHNVGGGKDEGNTGYYLWTDAQLAMDFTSRLTSKFKLDYDEYDYSQRGTYSDAPWVTALYATSSATNINPFWVVQPANSGPAVGQVANLVLSGPSVTQNPVLTTGNVRNFTANTWTHQELRDNWSFTNNTSYDLDFAQLRYIFGAQHYAYDGISDFDGTNVVSYQIRAAANPTCDPMAATLCFTGGPSISHYTEDRRWYTHEVDLVSKGDSPLQWLAGATYYHNNFDNLVFFPGFNDALWSYSHPFGSAPNPLGYAYQTDNYTESNSTAGFGEVSYNFFQKLRVKAALRYTHDEKTTSEYGRGLALGTSTCFPLTTGSFTPSCDYTPFIVNNVATYKGVVGTPGIHRNLHDTWNGLGGTFGLEYRPNQDTMMYARYDRAYKAGAFNATGFGGADPEVAPEHVNAYTVGVKSRPLHNFVADAEVFHYDWYGRQTPVTYASGTPVLCPGPIACSTNINLGKSVSQGVDLMLRYSPISDMHLNVGYTYLDAKVKRAPGIVDTSSGSNANQNIVGNPLLNSPNNSYVASIDYTVRPDIGPITFTAAYNWVGEQYGGIFKTEYYRTPSSQNLNLSALWVDASGRFSILGSVKNATDELEYEYTNPGPRYSNTVPLSSTQPNNPADGTTYHSFGIEQPRIYSVELRAKF